MAGDILAANCTAAVVWQGRSIVIEQDVTLARTGHPILDTYGELFSPLFVHFEVDGDPAPAEAAPQTAPAGTPDPKAVRAWAAGNGVEVSAKGKIPDAVNAAFLAAQQGA
jgi:hypothetical protein